MRSYWLVFGLKLSLITWIVVDQLCNYKLGNVNVWIGDQVAHSAMLTLQTVSVRYYLLSAMGIYCFRTSL